MAEGEHTDKCSTQFCKKLQDFEELEEQNKVQASDWCILGDCRARPPNLEM